MIDRELWNSQISLFIKKNYNEPTTGNAINWDFSTLPVQSNGGF